ncbi:MAG: cytochrome c-type biogenesis protein [Pseudomonadota bacterium]|nr:cytochrome c-type biogenesis protein [Pseudomonadota bacterium]
MMRVLISAFLLVSSIAWAAPEGLSAKEMDRYHDLLEELRCLVCQNQNLAESNASLANDLKRQVEDMIRAGQTDEQIKTYLQARYGDFVLYRPPFKPSTWVLWVSPFVVLVTVLFIAWLTLRRRRVADTPAASIDRDALKRLLENE